jgi:membrane-bound serine protease (ClpP class)
MSRIPFQILVYLITALSLTIGFADDVEKAEGKDAADYEEFVGVDISEMSKEELIPFIEGLELPKDGPLKIAVIPVKRDIGNPILYILRRSIKDAMTNGADVVVLDMDTPGGRLDTTLEIMEVLNEFPGITITFINDEAISAGAIISSVTDYIYFAPLGIMGAAAAVSSGGQEIPETMQAKIKSYLDARIESYKQNNQLRNKVIKAMMDKDLEFVEDNFLISPKGELLSLTASKSVVKFGDPARPLIANGIAESLEEIFEYGFGTKDIVITEYEPLWSEDLASFLELLTPVLFGIGIVMLVVEMKTPAFGLLGGVGIGLILIAVFGHNVAGLAGFEAILLLLGGVVLVAIEIFVLPGTFIFGVLGVFCILGGMVWSFADIWPVVPGPGLEPVDWKINTASLEAGVINLAISLAIASSVIAVLWKYLPNSALLRRVVSAGRIANPSPVIVGGGRYADGDSLPDIGTEGVVISDLHPLGLVEINGKRFEATTSVGHLKKEDRILVVGYKNYSLLVDKKQ